MKCLTIVTAMSGHGGHGLARKIAEFNPEYRWYDHPRNSKDHPDRFPELELAQNHFRKRFKNNDVFPHLFDRIESLISDKDSYYSMVIKEIETLSQGKRLVYVCHETPEKIKFRFPESKVVQILPTENILDAVIDRHMITHMMYPVQQGLHNLPGRSNLLNDLYWTQSEWAKQNKNQDAFIYFQSFLYKVSVEEIKIKEREFQKELYKRQLKTSDASDVSMIVETVEEALERI